MATIERSIVIEAPLEKVFDYMDYPPHQAEMLPNGGSRSDWTYKMFGVKLEGSVEAVEYGPNEKIFFEMTGSIGGRISWTFEERNNAKEVTYHADYALPIPRLGEPLTELAAGYNEREVEATLANLKARMEA